MTKGTITSTALGGQYTRVASTPAFTVQMIPPVPAKQEPPPAKETRKRKKD
jgi:hypothetical protein